MPSVFEILLNKWDVTLPQRSLETTQTEPTRRAIIFLSCFLFPNFNGVRRFFLLSTFLTWEILKIWSFSLHSRVIVFHFFDFYCVCGGGGGRESAAQPLTPADHLV